MKKFSKLLLGAAILGVGIGGAGIGMSLASPVIHTKAAATANPYVWTLAKGQLTSAAGSTTINGVSWSWSAIKNYTFDTQTPTRGAQLGSKSNPAGAVTFTTSLNNFGTTLTSITVNACTGGAGTVSATANGTTIITSTALTTTSADYSSDTLSVPTTTGDLVITITGTTKAAYLKSITIGYSVPQNYATNLEAILSEDAYPEGTVFDSANQIAATATYNGTAGTTYTNFSAEVGSKTGETYTKRTDLVDHTTRFVASDNTVRITALDPTTAGGSTYASIDLALSITAATDYYTLVTSLDDLRLGSEIVFANISAGVALNTTIDTANHKIGAVGVAIVESKLLNATGVNGFSLGVGSTKDSYTLKSKSNSQYLYNDPADTSYLGTQVTNDVNGEWAISFDATDHHVTLTSQGTTATYLEYYTNAFTTYKYVPSKAEAEVFVYQKVASLGSLSSLSLVTNPTKTQYSTGETFDKTGIKVNAVFDDASSTTVDVSNWITFPTGLFVGGETKITGTVNVLGVSKTLDVTIQVETVTLTSIGITTPASKLTYLVGETLDTTGIVVTATYSNNNTTDVTASCTFSPANGSTLSTAGTTTVMVTFEGKTTSYEVTVNTPITYVFYKVESAAQLKVGARVLIGATASSKTYFMSATQKSNNRDAIAGVSEAENYSFPENATDVALFTLCEGTTTGQYSLKDGNGYNPNNWAVAGTRFGGKTGTLISALTNGPTGTANYYCMYLGSVATFTDAITKVEITSLANFGTVTMGKVYLQSSANADFSSSTNLNTTFAASSTMTFTLTGTANQYYRIVFEKASSPSNNVGCIISHVKFFKTAETVSVTGITISGNAAQMVGEAQILTPSITPATASDKTVTWSSSDTSIATVSASGAVTAINNGSVTITATANDGSGIEGTFAITVSGAPSGTARYIVNGVSSGLPTSYPAGTDYASQGVVFHAVNVMYSTSYYQIQIKRDAAACYYNVTKMGADIASLTINISNYSSAAKDFVITMGSTVNPSTVLAPTVTNLSYKYTPAAGTRYFKIAGSTTGTTYINSIVVEFGAAETAATAAAYVLGISPDIDSSKGYCTGVGGNYSLAKSIVTSLASTELTTFQNSADSTIAAARTRYVLWASRYGDLTPYATTYGSAARLSLSDNNSGPNLLIIVASTISIVATAGFFFFHKKKHA